jgi:hypothetical protein
MDKEAYEGDEYQTKGYLLVMCAQAKFRAEAMAASSTVRQALAVLKECE